MMGIAPDAAPESKPIEVKGDTYEEKIQSLKDQGHDISKMPESSFPDDMKDVYHFEQGKAQREDFSKGLSEISERMSTVGVNPAEQKSIFQSYGIGSGTLGQPAITADLLRQPIEDQYKQAYDVLAKSRGIEEGQKINAQTMDDAQKSVDAINGYFNPQSQEVKKFAEQHADLSNHDVAQMAYNRDLLESPNPDALKSEIDKAKQEKISFDRTAGSTIERPPKEIPEARTPSSVASNLNEYKDEIKNIATPYKGAPLAASIMREKLGLMARRMDMAEAAMEQAKKMFDKWTPKQVTEFYDNAENGRPPGNP